MLTGRWRLDIGGADVAERLLVVSPGYSLAGTAHDDGTRLLHQERTIRIPLEFA